jgi:hypothetical protein
MSEWLRRNRTNPLMILAVVGLAIAGAIFLYTAAMRADAQIAQAATTWLTELETAGVPLSGFGLVAMAVGIMAGIAGVVYTGIATVIGGAIIANVTALTGFFGGGVG